MSPDDDEISGIFLGFLFSRERVFRRMNQNKKQHHAPALEPTSFMVTTSCSTAASQVKKRNKEILPRSTSPRWISGAEERCAGPPASSRARAWSPAHPPCLPTSEKRRHLVSSSPDLSIISDSLHGAEFLLSSNWKRNVLLSPALSWNVLFSCTWSWFVFLSCTWRENVLYPLFWLKYPPVLFLELKCSPVLYVELKCPSVI